MRPYVKICGVTRVRDATLAADAGADAVGVNWIERSKRFVDPDTSAEIVRAVGHRCEVVAVVADLAPSEARQLAERTGVHRLQLHGSEPPERVRELMPLGYKAVRIRDAADVERAWQMPGAPLLTDAFAPGQLGGSGHVFDWSLVVELAAARQVLLAGGLTPDNIAAAVRTVRPWGVDVASGVEVPGNPRSKDFARMEAFVRAARQAFPS